MFTAKSKKREGFTPDRNQNKKEFGRIEKEKNRHDVELKFSDQLNIFRRMKSLQILLLYSNFYDLREIAIKISFIGFQFARRTPSTAQRKEKKEGEVDSYLVGRDESAAASDLDRTSVPYDSRQIP